MSLEYINRGLSLNNLSGPKPNFSITPEIAQFNLKQYMYMYTLQSLQIKPIVTQGVSGLFSRVFFTVLSIDENLDWGFNNIFLHKKSQQLMEI